MTLSRMSKSVVLIDFGRSIDMELLPDGSQFTVSCYTEQFECVEMQSGRPWTYQMDYYGLLSCVHMMIHNEYMSVMQDKEGRWVPTKKPHRRVDRAFFGMLYDTFLNVPDCDNLPNLGRIIDSLDSLVKGMTTRSRAEGLMDHYKFMEKME